jgi:16S rRNA (guanine527-N7)-methyltransferase
VADIGSGAGFPGIVWSIFRPDLDVTLFERKERTHAFLERVIGILAMGGVRALAEDAAEKPRAGSFDLAISKAAGRLWELLPLAEKLVLPGGAYLTIKGSSWREELDSAKSSAMRFERAAELPEGRGYALTFRKG